MTSVSFSESFEGMSIYLKIAFLNFCFIAICQFSNGQNKTEIKNLKAICRADNDFVTYNDTLSPKEPVPSAIKQIISKSYKKYNPALEPGTGSILAFKINYTRDIAIYVVKYISFDAICYQLIGYNTVSHLAAVKHPPIINGKWMDNREEGFDSSVHLLSGHMSYFKDVDHDGKIDFIVKERVHNGTVYNGVIEHAYYIDAQMNLDQIICIETKFIDPYNGCIINRVLKNNVLFVTTTCNGETTLIGKVKLHINSDKKIIYSKIYQKEYADALITGIRVNEEAFLKKGYNFWY